MGFWTTVGKAAKKAGKHVRTVKTSTGKYLKKVAKKSNDMFKKMNPTNRKRDKINTNNKNLRAQMTKQFNQDKRRLQGLADKGDLTKKEFHKQMADLTDTYNNRLRELDNLYVKQLNDLDEIALARRKQTKKDVTYAEEQLKEMNARNEAYNTTHAQKVFSDEAKDLIKDINDPEMRQIVRDHAVHDFDVAWKENPQAVKSSLQILAELYPNAKMRKLVKNAAKMENIPLAMKKQIVDSIMTSLISMETVGTALASTMEGLDFAAEQEKQRTIREYIHSNDEIDNGNVSFGTNIIGKDWV